MRKTEEIFVRILMMLATFFIIAILLYIIYIVFSAGISSLSWEMISSTPGSGYYYGKDGGILNAIAGSVYLSLGSITLAIIIGIPAAMMLNVYCRKSPRFTLFYRFLLDMMWGIPSIVYGAFGFLIMVWLGMRSSLGGAMITVTAFILPIIIRAVDDVLQQVPKGMAEAGYALGAGKRVMAFNLYFRQALPGIITAILLSFGRAIGDAAAVLFTAGFTDSVPDSLSSPAATLPLAVFFQLGSPIPEVRQRAYAAAVVLTVIILIISVTSRLITKKYRKHQIRF